MTVEVPKCIRVQLSYTDNVEDVQSIVMGVLEGNEDPRMISQ
jgi:hypothetical protein